MRFPKAHHSDRSKDMLISEFGKDYANYFSILSLIAEGKTTQREIDSIINKTPVPI